MLAHPVFIQEYKVRVLFLKRAQLLYDRFCLSMAQSVTAKRTRIRKSRALRENDPYKGNPMFLRRLDKDFRAVDIVQHRPEPFIHPRAIIINRRILAFPTFTVGRIKAEILAETFFVVRNSNRILRHLEKPFRVPLNPEFMILIVSKSRILPVLLVEEICPTIVRHLPPHVNIERDHHVLQILHMEHHVILENILCFH